MNDRRKLRDALKHASTKVRSAKRLADPNDQISWHIACAEEALMIARAYLKAEKEDDLTKKQPPDPMRPFGKNATSHAEAANRKARTHVLTDA